jgi:RNA polymerase sigma-70 factor (ECF subfamily)
LLSLPIRLQGALALHYLEELPVVEIARILDCREGTVKSRLARGRDALRRRLQQMGWDR